MASSEMNRRHITGFSNPTVKALRALREKKHRKASGRFLAEGLRLLTDARECGHVPETLVLADRRDPHPLLSALEAAVESGVFTEFDTSLGALDRSRSDIWLVAQALRDPGNLGTMLRTGDAIGAGGVILIDDCADPFSVEAVRASMGAVFTQSIALARWDEFESWLRAGTGQLVAASLRDAQPYRSAPYAAPCFVMVGNESRGLPEEYEMACDLRVTMPMKGRADSLNAAVAAAVLGYEVLAALDA